MKKSEHRPGVSEAYLVNRHLKLDCVNQANRDPLLDEIDQLCGIERVAFDDHDSVLHLSYDASHCQLGELEAIIDKHGAKVADGWWNSFKEGYYRFVDQNVKDNAHHKPLSCHQAPPNARTKKK